MEIKTVDRLNATVEVPGSKSYTQRALVVASLAGGKSNLSNALISDDIRYLVEALRFLGAEIIISGSDVTVTGTDGKIRNPGRAIIIGNNGTALRFLTTLAAIGKGEYTLDGSSRLRKRPLEPLLDALKILGVESQSSDGYPPVRIDAIGLKGGRVSFADVKSSQYISSLLIGAPYAEGDIEIALTGRTVSEPYIDMTMDVMRHFGAEVRTRGKGLFSVKSRRHYKGQRYMIEGDASSASYFFLAAALCRGRVKVVNMNPASLQGDINILGIMEDLGCSVARGDE